VDLSKGELRAPTASSSSPSERILLPPLWHSVLLFLLADRCDASIESLRQSGGVLLPPLQHRDLHSTTTAAGEPQWWRRGCHSTIATFSPRRWCPPRRRWGRGGSRWWWRRPRVGSVLTASSGPACGFFWFFYSSQKLFVGCQIILMAQLYQVYDRRL
jgi:hypothetical protein